MTHLERAEMQIARGKSLALVRDSLKQHFEEVEHNNWIVEKQKEYDSLFKTNEIKEEVRYFDNDMLNEVTTTETVRFDYVDDAPTFNEWVNETRVISEAVEPTYDEDGVELTPYIPEATEQIRPYIAKDVSSKVEAYLEKTASDRINKEYEEKVANLTKGVPDTEKNTWNKQELEARAYLEDNNANVPFIRTLAESRGVLLDYLAQRIIEKAEVYSVELGKLTGEKQRKLDLLEG